MVSGNKREGFASKSMVQLKQVKEIKDRLSGDRRQLPQ